MYETALNKVPSPPILNKISTLSFKSSCELNVATSFLNLNLFVTYSKKDSSIKISTFSDSNLCTKC